MCWYVAALTFVHSEGVGSRGIGWCDFWRFDLIVFKQVQLLVCSRGMFAIKTDVELLNASCSFDFQLRYNKTTFFCKELTFYQALKAMFTNHVPSGVQFF
jgi:hypothetical protein